MRVSTVMLFACAILTPGGFSQEKIKLERQFVVGNQVDSCDFDNVNNRFACSLEVSDSSSLILLIQVKNGKTTVLSKPNTVISTVAFSASKRFVFGADVLNGAVYAWDVTKKKAYTFRHAPRIAAIATVGPRFLGVQRVGEFPSLHTFDEEARKLNLFRKEELSAMVFASSNSSKGPLIAYGSGFLLGDRAFPPGHVRVFQVKARKVIAKIPGPRSNVRCLEFFQDGKRLAVGYGNGQIRVFDSMTGRRVAEMDLKQTSANAIAVSPDCGRLVTGNRDGTISLFDLKNSKKIDQLNAHGNSVAQVDFMKEDRRFYSVAFFDRKIKIWNVAGLP